MMSELYVDPGDYDYTDWYSVYQDVPPPPRWPGHGACASVKPQQIPDSTLGGSSLEYLARQHKSNMALESAAQVESSQPEPRMERQQKKGPACPQLPLDTSPRRLPLS